MLVGIAAAIKLTPGLFIVYFAVTRQWAAAARAAGTFVACALVGAIVLPHPSQEFWSHLVFDPTRPSSPFSPINQSIYGTILRGGGPRDLWPVLALAAAAFGLWRAARAHEAGAEVAAVWIVPMLAVLAAWATNPVQPARVWATVAVLAFLAVPWPQVGNHLVVSAHVPILPRVVEAFDVILFAAMVMMLPAAAVSEPERERTRASSAELPVSVARS
ncbi:MAG: hypothetical protein NVSMB32_16900 [Actinomycetota bacterium]